MSLYRLVQQLMSKQWQHSKRKEVKEEWWQVDHVQFRILQNAHYTDICDGQNASKLQIAIIQLLNFTKIHGTVS
jgi:hypothetical protein